MNIRLGHEAFRKVRAIEVPVGRGARMFVGWECKRPFAKLQRHRTDPDCGYQSWETTSLIGGCLAWQGADCEYECDGCIAYATAYETSYTDAMTEAESDVLYDDATALGELIGHHPTRCGMNPDNIDGLVSVGVD